MKRVVVPNVSVLNDVKVVEGPSGLETFIDRQIFVMCANYFYTGKLTGINTDSIELSDASLIYETGPWTSKSYLDAQKLPGKVWYIQTASIESFGESK